MSWGQLVNVMYTKAFVFGTSSGASLKNIEATFPCGNHFSLLVNFQYTFFFTTNLFH